MNTYIRCSLLVTLLLTLAVCGVSQTSAPHQKSLGKADTSAAKPLSFFDGAWIYSKQIDNFIVQLRMKVSMSTQSDPQVEEHGYIHRDLGCTSQAVMSGHCEWYDEEIDWNVKGKIAKVGDEFKYIQNSDAEHCTQTLHAPLFENTPEKKEQRPCDVAKTYTLKVASQDEVERVYKPTGEELKLQRE
jgi:hypothetical protein